MPRAECFPNPDAAFESPTPLEQARPIKMSPSSTKDLSKRRYVYRLDAAGRWSYGRNPVDDPELARQFFRDIYKEGDAYRLECEGEICTVRVDDAPSFVEEVTLRAAGDALDEVVLTLASGARESLDPATLTTAADGALICTDSRGLRTKFRRGPHLALARYIRETSDGRYVLALREREYEIALRSD